ncbi:hypothetical protein HO133_008909 [Letharia lupina]|uniref:Uncharacterized protein n=1 Tax=Letharia lupina TaxID=560253 RepID=A0A8H6FGJ6_9LECA|nr:uncharacterized protein HO133_008909 [Letharia lupina]KAF6227465.1 hypothetical protein HO133_008909 [Letharia lupina]
MPATPTDELRFLRTLTPPPPTSSTSNPDSDDYDPYRSPSPENTTGVQFDPRDRMWRCTRCGWEVETIDGVQGSDLTRVDGWFSTCEWDVGMWSDQGGEDGSFDGNEGRSEDEFIFLGEVGEMVVGGSGGEDDEEREDVVHDDDDDDGDDMGWIVENEDVEDEVWEGDDDTRMEDEGPREPGLGALYQRDAMEGGE